MAVLRQSQASEYTKRGFTLIELLIVLAIIGILAAVVLSSLSGVRERAQRTKTIASLMSAHTVAITCMDDGNNLNVPAIGDPVCAGMGFWPAPVGSSWAYGDAGTCAFDGDVSDNTFTYCASDGVEVITCTQDSCSIE